MRVLEIASEAVPFAKTGGLADVAGALPEALAELGCDVTLMVPAYAEALGKGLPIEPAGIEFDVPIGTGSRRARILRCRREGQRADVYLIANDDLFDRPTLYGGASDEPDNAERLSSSRGPRWNSPAGSVARGTFSTVTIGRRASCRPTVGCCMARTLPLPTPAP